MFPSKYFKRKEFSCKCGCGSDTVDAELLVILDDLREWCNAPCVINSGHRCPAHNKRQGGAPNSWHLKGRAADVRCAKKTPKECIAYLMKKYPDTYGFIEYDSFVHVDSRSVKYHKPK